MITIFIHYHQCEEYPISRGFHNNPSLYDISNYHIHTLPSMWGISNLERFPQQPKFIWYPQLPYPYITINVENIQSREGSTTTLPRIAMYHTQRTQYLCVLVRSAVHGTSLFCLLHDGGSTYKTHLKFQAFLFHWTECLTALWIDRSRFQISACVCTLSLAMQINNPYLEY